MAQRAYLLLDLLKKRFAGPSRTWLPLCVTVCNFLVYFDVSLLQPLIYAP